MVTIKTNQNKNFIPIASPEKITGKWKDLVDVLIEIYKKNLGENLVSIYIGGSVASGTAIENKSDIDIYGITNLKPEEVKNDPSWMKESNEFIKQKFSFVTKADMHIYTIHDLPSKLKFELKITAAHVFGEKLDEKFPEYKLNKETISSIRRDMEKEINTAKEKLSKAKGANQIQKISKWIAKRLLRHASFLSMWDENFLILDITPEISRIFIKKYPKQKEAIEKTYSYTQNPPENKEEMLDLLNTFGSWIIEEDKKVFEL